jgi:hypothetical protein
MQDKPAKIKESAAYITSKDTLDVEHIRVLYSVSIQCA